MEAKMNELVGSKLWFEIGSMHTGAQKPRTREEIINYVGKAIIHNMFDWNFYFNWTDNKDEYMAFFINNTLPVFINEVDFTLQTHFSVESVYGRLYLGFCTPHDVVSNWIDNWFKSSEISEDVKKDYYYYRRVYAGVEL